MARRPARLERAGALTPRDRMWSAIRALGTPTHKAAWFSPIEVQFLANLRVAPAAQVHVDSVMTYLRGLSRATAPYVRLESEGRPMNRAELHLYRLVRDVGVDAPRVTKDGKPVTDGISSEQMWAAIKVLREFDYKELVVAASTPAHPVSPANAKTYLHHLTRAGYLFVATPCSRSRGNHALARYRFNRARNTGPRAPLVCKDKSVMDANAGQVVWKPGAAK